MSYENIQKQLEAAKAKQAIQENISEEEKLELYRQRIEILERGYPLTQVVEMSIQPIRWIGYLFLLTFLLDMINVILPLNFFNAEWEYNVIINIIERLPIPILGLVGIFWGGLYLRSKIELTFLMLLSWFMLVIAVSLLFLMPILHNNAHKMHKVHNVKLELIQEKLLKMQTVLNYVENMKDIAELEPYLEDFGLTKIPKLSSPEALEPFKNILIQRVNTEEEKYKQAEQEMKTKIFKLKKHEVIIIIETIISIIIFVIIWLYTDWARLYKELDFTQAANYEKE